MYAKNINQQNHNHNYALVLVWQRTSLAHICVNFKHLEMAMHAHARMGCFYNTVTNIRVKLGAAVWIPGLIGNFIRLSDSV